MNDEIKEILDYFKNYVSDKYESYTVIDYHTQYIKVLLDYTTNLQEENERLKEQNNDLRKIYKNTYNRLFKNGNDELARYFQAQIDDCPTFYIEPIVDYHKEWKDYKSRVENAIEYIEKHTDKLKTIRVPKIDFDYNDLLNILQGESNEE